MSGKKPSQPYYVTSLKQLLALASPGREDIIDAVRVTRDEVRGVAAEGVEPPIG